MRNVTCPSCKGAKESFVMACGPGGGRYGMMSCDRCSGTGEITEEYAERIKLHRRLREDRVNVRCVSQREEAARLGCGVGEWSRIEYGKEPVTEEGRRALAVRLKEISAEKCYQCGFVKVYSGEFCDDCEESNNEERESVQY